MKYDADNISNVDISTLQDFKIVFVGSSNRRKTKKEFLGKPNCSGYNINQLVRKGISVAQYQAIIRNNFSPADPQFSLTKHLKYDIEQGFIELVGD